PLDRDLLDRVALAQARIRLAVGHVGAEPAFLDQHRPATHRVRAEVAQRRGGGATAAPLRDLGPDPVSGRPVLVKEGRFGPYVTDGESNASLRKGDSVEEVTIER